MKPGHGFGKLGAVPGLVGNPLHGLGKRISPKLIGNDGYDRVYGSLNVFRVLVLATKPGQLHHCPRGEGIPADVLGKIDGTDLDKLSAP